MNDPRIVIAIYGLLVTILLAVGAVIIKHISNDKHPSKDSLVYRDVCKSERKRLDDCIEGAIKRSDEHYEQLTQYMKEGFARLERAINGSSKRT